MSADIRVCQLITALGHGGAENLVVDLVDTVEDVAFTVGYFGAEDALVEDVEATGANVHSFDEDFRFDPRAFARLVRFFKRQQFDVVHLHLPYTQTVGRIAASITGVGGIVSTQHNIPSNYHPVTRTTERLTRGLDDTTVAVSQGVERAFTGTAHPPNQLGNDWCTIYNGIDVEGFADAVAAAAPPDVDAISAETVFLSVGRYVPVKGQMKLIEAFDETEFSDAVLVLVGHGPLEGRLRSAVSDRGLGDRIHITGRVPAVEPYYALADVFVSASRGEGMPVTLLEAMAAELPVVATSIPGIDEVVVDGKTGYLCPPDDTAALSNCLSRLRSERPREALGKAGKARAREHFSIDRMASAYRSLYLESVDRT